MKLTEFLLARIAEDEAEVRRRPRNDMGADWVIVPTSGARTLAECEAKRGIVSEARRLGFNDPARVGPTWDGRRDAFETTMRYLADVYSDHPDYREEWRA